MLDQLYVFFIIIFLFMYGFLFMILKMFIYKHEAI